MLSSRVEWHLKGTSIWILSLLGLVVNAILIVQKLRHPNKYSIATVFAIMVAVSSIGMIIMEQSTFLSENISPVTAPDWLWSINKFTSSNYCYFLRALFPYIVDLAVVNNQINLYVLICRPQSTQLMLSKTVTTGEIAFNLGLSSIFASLTTKLENDLRESPGLTINGSDNVQKIWISKVVLVICFSMTTCGFCLFFTCKIRATLLKAIKFLRTSNATGRAAEAYERIIKVSMIICVIFLVYNLLIVSLDITVHFIRFSEATGFDSNNYQYDAVRSMNLLNAIVLIRLVNNIIVCFKPCCYGIAFIAL